MVGDQALLAPDQRAQLTDPSIAVGELGKELPAQRIGRQAQELRWRLFGLSLQEPDNTSIQFDGAAIWRRCGRLENVVRGREVPGKLSEEEVSPTVGQDGSC
jgi:hypothetical protein